MMGWFYCSVERRKDGNWELGLGERENLRVV